MIKGSRKAGDHAKPGVAAAGGVTGNGAVIKSDEDKSMSLKVTDTQGHMYESTY